MIAAVAAGIGHGLAYGGATAAIDAAIPDGRRGAISAALYLAFYCGAGIPAVAVGMLALWHPLTTAISWLSAAAATLVPLIGAALVVTNRGSRSPVGAPIDSPPPRRSSAQDSVPTGAVV